MNGFQWNSAVHHQPGWPLLLRMSLAAMGDVSLTLKWNLDVIWVFWHAGICVCLWWSLVFVLLGAGDGRTGPLTLWMNPWPVLGCALGSGIPLWPRGSGKPQHFTGSSSKDSPARSLFLSVSIGLSLKIICNARYCSAEFPSRARGMCWEPSLDQRPQRGARSQAKVQEYPSDPEDNSTKKSCCSPEALLGTGGSCRECGILPGIGSWLGKWRGAARI